MSDTKSLNDVVNFRCNSEMKKEFVALCDKNEQPYQVVFRNLMRAMVEGRVTIQPKKR